MADRAADEAEIRALLDSKRTASIERDFDAFANCFVDAPYTARWNASRVSGNFVRQGWDEISARMRESMLDEPGGSLGESRVDDLNIRISGDLAWVTFTRAYLNEPAHRAGPDPAYHLRIVERRDGRWKFVFVGFLDTGLGRPGAALIRLAPDGSVIWTNRRAQAQLTDEDDVVIRNGKLRLRETRANQKLQAAIGWAAGLDRGISPERGALPIVVDRGEGLAAKVWWVIGDGGAILFCLGDAANEAQRLDAAAIVYALSPAQRRLATHVVAGLTIADIAVAMEIRPNTVRTHLDRMFEKTGVRNQTALVRVLLSASAPL